MGSITIGTKTVTGINIGTGIDVGTKTTSITENGNYDVDVFGYAANRISVAVSGGGVDTDFLCFTAGEANSTVGLTTGSAAPTPELYISTDNKQTWSAWDGTAVTLANVGDKMYVYGNNATMSFSSTTPGCNSFTMTGSIAASGDVTSLLDRKGVDKLPAYAFNSLFNNCTALTSAPSLPATTLAPYCYQYMFQGCTGLTTVQATLPATTLFSNCYSYMFKHCTSLTTAPALPASTLASSCYAQMFYGCSSLNRIEVSATTWSTTNASNWVNGVAASGTFLNNNGTVIAEGISGVPTGWTVAGPKNVTMSGAGNSSYKYQIGSGSEVTVQAYSGDTTVTVPYGESLTLTALTPGGYIYIGNNEIGDTATYLFNNLQNAATFDSWMAETDYVCFEAEEANSTVAMTATGGGQPTVRLYISTDNKQTWSTWDKSAVTLANVGDKVYLYGNNNKAFREMASSWQGYWSFVMTGKIAASGNIKRLMSRKPVPELGSYAYSYLFAGCTALTSAPTLDIAYTTNYIFSHMFDGCTGLTQAPALPAMTLSSNCYRYMFNGCTSLAIAPDLRNVTTTAVSCCSNMYNGCTSLETAYAPDRNTWTTSQFTNWLANVAATGTLYATGRAAGVIPTDSTNGCPSGWTVVIAPIFLHFDGPLSYTYGGTTTAVASGDRSSLAMDVNGGDLVITTADVYEQLYKNNVHQGCGTDYTYDYAGLANGDVFTSVSVTPDCTCWQEQGYADIEECNCAEFGEDCPDQCQECIANCEGDPECEEMCYECDNPCGEPCNVCNEWQERGYESYEDCQCQQYGECGEE